MNKLLKEKAIALRKKGKSYNDISTTLLIPKSTLSGWLKNKQWSKAIKSKLTKSSAKFHKNRLIELNKVKRAGLEKIYMDAELEAAKEFIELKWFPLFVSGISIYWGEGDKINKYFVRVSNTDSTMLKVFVKFLLEICGVQKDKIKSYILIYPDLKEKPVLDYWSKALEIPLENFNKCVRIQGRHKVNRLNYGVCTVYVSSTYLKRKINIWLKLIGNDLT
ncbi:MAG TPA: hypothetical protein PKD79_00965 [Candidatus Doudnabacteria bacterium]|nr:hypothetical protein [Candidatus Doudnabacteria bacterium]